MYKNGNSFVFARSLITCFYHIKYIWYYFLPRRSERKVVVIVSSLLGFTMVFESRNYSAALIKAALTFFQGVSNQFYRRNNASDQEIYT